MSLLSQVKTGKIPQPILALIYGVDGVGKSTFGAQAPSPIFLGAERGTANLDVARFSPSGFKQTLQFLDELMREQHTHKTLVVDSVDWLEPQLWEQVCIDHNWKSIEDPGYGKGYVLSLKYWQDFINRLTRLRELKGMNIILIAHAQVKLAKDPQAQAEYDRYQLKLNDKAAALLREYVDSVLFANFEVVTKTEKGKTKAFGDGDRCIFTERRPGFDAKNRFSLPFQMKLDWNEFASQVTQATEAPITANPQELMALIQELISQVEDQKLVEAATQWTSLAGGDPVKLNKVYQKLQTYVA